MRALRSPRAPLVGLLLLVATTAVFVTYWAWRVDIVLPDEMLGVLGSRAILRDSFEALSSQVIFPRGLERLFSIVMLLPNLAFSDVSNELKSAHALIAFAAALTAVPVYAIGREIGLSGWWSLLAATMTVVSPWLLYSETFLNGTLATLTLTTFLFVVLRSTLRPSAWGDMLIIVLTILMSLARTNQVAFFAVAPLAIVVHSMRSEGGAAGFRARLKALPGRSWRDHKTFVVITLAGIVLAAVVGLNAVVGHYSNALPWEHLDSRLLWNHTGLTFTSLAFATGFVPMVFGAWWLLRNVVRPDSPGAGAFAVIGTSTIAIFIATTYYAVPEERYIAVLACIVPVAFAAALSSGRIGVIGTIASAGVLSFLALKFGYYPNIQPLDVFIGPGRIFISQVLAAKVLLVSPYDGSPLALTLALLSLVAVASAIGFHRWQGQEVPTRRLAGVLAGLAVCAALLSAGWGLRSLTHSLTVPNVNYENASWIDRAAGGESVGLMQTGDAFELFPSQNLLLHNKKLDTAVWFGPQVSPGPCCSNQLKNVVAKPDAETGAMPTDYPPPRKLVVPASAPYGIAGRRLASGYAYAGSVPHRMIRPEAPLRLQWLGVGLAGGPSLGARGRAKIYVYPLSGHNGPVCVRSRIYVDRGAIVLSSSPAPVGGKPRMRMPFDTKKTLTWRFPRVEKRETIELSQVAASSKEPDAVIYLDETTAAACR